MIAEIAGREWDVIIVGAGLGGGVLGRRLAEKGLKVLFLERGPFGPIAEQQKLRNDVQNELARRIRGYWPTQLNTTIDGRQSFVYGPVGSGVGGSSAFYAATLERPERHDIDHTDERPHPTGGWPVRFDTFADYFADAEHLFHVCGEADPLSNEKQPSLLPYPELEPGELAMMSSLRQCGLHPYRLHMGVRFIPECGMCFGQKCPRACKMDGRSAGVGPALATGNAAILEMCDVHELRGTKDRIDHVVAEVGGELVKFRAKQYVVASGGFGTPRLLLGSKSEAWPNGCANSSGLVGRNLMFHLAELVLVWPKSASGFTGPTRGIGLRDFYFKDGQRYGALQAIGVDAAYGEVYHAMRIGFDKSRYRALWPIRELLRIPAWTTVARRGYAKIFRGFVEDLPYETNRVTLDTQNPKRIKFEYEIGGELEARRQDFRHLVKSGLKGHRSLFLTSGAELDFSHVCGTARFGTDPQKSVVDADCRAHDVKNLLISDASFMPTSTGINPGLLVAANALRVADAMMLKMADRHR